MKKIHVLLDFNSIKKIKKNAYKTDLILCAKGLAKHIDFCENTHELKGYSVSNDVKDFSNRFEIDFAKLEDNGFIIESQVNDVFKFIFLESLEICEFLSACDESEIVLYNGNKNIKFISVFMACNTEVANPILSSRSRIVNPFLYEWINSLSKFKVSWHSESLIKLVCIKFLRNFIIFGVSTLTAIKSTKLKWDNKIPQTRAVAIYRTKDQLINLEVLKTYFGQKLAFVQGPAIGQLNSKSTNSLVSFPILLESIVASFKNYVGNFVLPSNIAKFQFLGGEFQIKSKDVVNEASLLITSYVHYLGLKACLEHSNAEFVFTSEMTSRYAVIEKLALKNINSTATFVGLQFISMGNLIVPYFPVQDKLIVKSKSDEKLISALYSDSDVRFLGSFSVTKFFGGEVLYQRSTSKNLVFFTQPYGVEDNKNILSLILAILPSDWLCIVRRHPRDFARYESISPRIKYDENSHYLETLVEADIVVAKTSSILSECLDFEKLHMAVLIDNYSQSIIDSIAGKRVNKVFTLDDFERSLRLLLSEFKYQKEIYAPKNLLLSKFALNEYLKT